jgi:hypothetical protein
MDTPFLTGEHLYLLLIIVLDPSWGVKKVSDNRVDTPAGPKAYDMGNEVIPAMFGYQLVSLAHVPLGGRILSTGMTGSDVYRLQTLLKGMGLYVGEVDGQFGVLTEEAVLLLQRLCFRKTDGRAGPDFFRLLQEIVEQGAWLVHRVGRHETLSSIAKGYGVAPGALRSPAKFAGFGQPVLIPRREVWLLWGEWYTTVECTGLLVPADTEGDRIPELGEKTVVNSDSVQDFLKKRRVRGDSWVWDCRGLGPDFLRKTLRKCLRLNPNERPWLWLEEEHLAYPGLAMALKIHGKHPAVAGLIVHLTPPPVKGGSAPGQLGRWRRMLHGLPVLLHLDLGAVLETTGGRHRITPKETRYYLLRSGGQPERCGSYAWASWEVEHQGQTARLWLPDRLTLQRVLGDIVREGWHGVVFTGINTVNRHSLEKWRGHFALKRYDHDHCCRALK